MKFGEEVPLVRRHSHWMILNIPPFGDRKVLLSTGNVEIILFLYASENWPQPEHSPAENIYYNSLISESENSQAQARFTKFYFISLLEGVIKLFLDKQSDDTWRKGESGSNWTLSWLNSQRIFYPEIWYSLLKHVWVLLSFLLQVLLILRNVWILQPILYLWRNRACIMRYAYKFFVYLFVCFSVTVFRNRLTFKDSFITTHH